MKLHLLDKLPIFDRNDAAAHKVLDEIHGIRSAHYEQTKDMTVQEKIEFYNKTGSKVQAEIERLRKSPSRRAV